MRFSPRCRSRWLVCYILPLALVAAVAATVRAADAPASGPTPKAGRGGGGRGFGMQTIPWWREIDTGPFISDTFRTERDGEIAALKGLAIKLGSARDVSVVFDTEL